MNDNELAAEQAAGLRALADVIEANPHIAPQFEYALKHGMNVFVRGDDAQGEMAELIRIALRHKGDITKQAVGEYMAVSAAWGAVTVDFNAARDQVCERVVTGVETVTKTVKDPEALAAVPDVEVTEEVETFEWKCLPLLAAGGES